MKKLLLSLVFILVAVVCPAYSATEVVTTSSLSDYYPDIAIDNSNIYITWYEYINADWLGLWFGEKPKEGNWGSNEYLGHGPYRYYYPAIAVDNSDQYLAWYDYTTSGSFDRGVRFRERINGVWGSLQLLSGETAVTHKPAIAVNDNRVFVAWSDYAGANPTSIFYRTKLKNGTWEPVEIVSTDIDCNEYTSYNPTIAADGTNVYLAWNDYHYEWDGIDPDTYVQYSDILFKQKSIDSNWPEHWETVKLGSSYDPSIAVDDSTVYLTWYDDNSEQVYFASKPKTGSWESSTAISTGSVGIQRGRPSNPTIAVNNTHVYVAWDEYVSDGWRYNVLLNSKSKGGSWGTPTLVNTESLNKGQRPSIAADNTDIYIAWQDNSGYLGSGTDSDIFFKAFGSTNQAPLVSNVLGKQRTDASRLVDIFYNLSDPEGDQCLIILEISNDEGATWTLPITSATGDIGSGITPDSGLKIVWDPTVDAPEQSGCTFKTRITAHDGKSGKTQAESELFCIDSNSPPPIPGANDIRVGQLTITGDNITKVNDGVWQIAGNAMVNSTIRLTGAVTANTSTLRVSGNGQIWIDVVPGLGDLMLYEGEWQFDGQTGATTTINSFLSSLKLAGMNINCSYIGIVDTAVKVQGYIELPPELGGGKVDIEGDHFVELSVENGLVYDLTISREIDVNVGGFSFIAQDSSVYLSNTGGTDECRISGTYELGDFLGGVTVDLDPAAGNYFSITNVEGVPKVDIVGSISIGEVIIVPPDIVYGRDLFLDMDTVTNSYYATGTVGFPVGTTQVDATGELEILGGYFNSASLVAEFDPAIAVLYTPTPPPVPVVYLYMIGGGVYNLSPVSEKAVVIMVTGGFQGGPEFFGYNLVELDLTGTLDLSGSVRGDAELRLGNLGPDEAILTGNATVIIDLNNGMYLAVEIRKDYNGQEFLSLGGKAAIDLNNNFTGSLKGIVTVPTNAELIGHILGGQEVSARAYVQAMDDVDYTNDYIAIGFRIIIEMPWPLEPIRMEPVIEINLTNNQINWLGSWARIKEVTFPGVEASMMMALGPTVPETFTVAPNLDYVIFRATWETGTTDLHIITPEPNEIRPDNVNDFDNVIYYTNYDANEVFYIVKDPMAGAWQLLLSEEIGIGDYTFQQLQESEAPTISIIEPAADTNDPNVTITWTDVDSDDDAKISLYYDTDRKDADGTIIDANISEDDSNNTYLWDTNGVPVGNYYVYAVITDGKNLPSISYSVGRVLVSDANAPLPPTNIAAAPTDIPSELLLTWTHSSEPNLHHYNVYYTADAAGELYDEVRGAGNKDTIILKDLLPGETYRLAVATVNDANEIGAHSEPVIVTLKNDSNHVPLFAGSIPTQAVVGQLYQFQVLTEDLDGDTINHSFVIGEPNIPDPPNGLTISSYRLLEWIPEPNQLGNHTFAIRLDDYNSVPTQRLFTLNVDGSNTSNWPPEILSEAQPLAEPNKTYAYQVVAKDPNIDDSLSYSLLIEPNDVTIDTNGLIEWQVPSEPGRYEFLVKVMDTAGLFVLQRFTVQVDLDAPTLNTTNWGSLTVPSPNSITIQAIPVPDATGLIEYLFEVDGNTVDWQRLPEFTADGLLPNTEHTFRVKVRDASPTSNQTVWAEPNSIYTLAEIPPAPMLVSTDINSLDVQLNSGNNPTTTSLALYNTSTEEWVNLSGAPSATAVWADSNTWDTVQVSELAFDTTYHLQCKARNGNGIESDLSPVVTAKTDEPNSIADVNADTDWLYENEPNSTSYQVNFSAAFVNDPYSNAEYTYTWQTPVNPTTGEVLVLVAGGEPNSATATYAAPESSASHPETYSVICTITGKQAGNRVTKTIEIDVLPSCDFNTNRIVNFEDFAILANYWLQNEPSVDIAPPPNGDGIVDYLDLEVLANHWLKSID